MITKTPCPSCRATGDHLVVDEIDDDRSYVACPTCGETYAAEVDHAAIIGLVEVTEPVVPPEVPVVTRQAPRRRPTPSPADEVDF